MEIKFNSTFKSLLDKYYLSESLNFLVDLPDELRQMVMDEVIVNNFGIGLAKTWIPNSASKPEGQSWHEDDENHFHVDSYADSDKYTFELGVKTLMALAKTFQNKNISNVQLTYSFQTPDMGRAEAIEQNIHDDSEHYLSDRLSFHTKRDGQIVVPDTLFNNKHQAFLTIDL